MPPLKEQLELPSSAQLLLTTLQTTDQKIDRPLPLLELLENPETSTSNLGQALLDALKRISEDLQEASSLREESRKMLDMMARTQAEHLASLAAISKRRQEEQSEIREMSRKIDNIHRLMSAPDE